MSIYEYLCLAWPTKSEIPHSQLVHHMGSDAQAYVQHRRAQPRDYFPERGAQNTVDNDETSSSIHNIVNNKQCLDNHVRSY